MADLQVIGQKLAEAFDQNRHEATTEENILDVQAMLVAEEAGEMVGAYRRYTGRARRKGTLQELEDEIADVFISTAIFAHRMGVDIEDVIRAKLDIIYSRGWKESE